MLNKSLIIVFLLIITNGLVANHGQTFEIEETPIFQSFKKENFLNNEKMQRSQSKQILSYLVSPPPVPGINEAKEYKRFYYDPIYQVREDITGLNGEIIAQKGQIINPLEKIESLQDLIFFDGDNPKHIQWAEKHTSSKWILVKGSPIDVEEITNHETFFDQMGMICTKFGVEHIPAKISKEENRILIEEVPCID